MRKKSYNETDAERERPASYIACKATNPQAYLQSKHGVGGQQWIMNKYFIYGNIANLTS